MKNKNIILLNIFLGVFFCIWYVSCNEKQNTIETNQKQIQSTKYLNENQLITFLEKTKGHSLNTERYIDPFKNIPFNKVIAYDFDGKQEKYTTIIDNKTKRFNPIVLRQKELNKEQIENVVSFLTDSKTYGEGTAACFIPHLAIVFYQDNKMVFEVDICLDCNYLQSTSEIPAAHTKKMKLEDGSEIDLIGFSKKGKLKIINICKELNLNYANYK